MAIDYMFFILYIWLNYMRNHGSVWIYIWLVVLSILKNMKVNGKHYPYTSSTAQGGGGSFKNRKPIGEVGCCESGMAERSH